MNTQLLKLKEKLKGKTVAVLGAGVSNRPLVPMFSSWGASVTVRDRNEGVDKAAVSGGYDVRFVLGDGYLDGLCEDYIFRSPGMRYDLPEIEKAVAAGSVLTSEMECFFDVCPGKIIGVTGSDGKTTTTTLIYKLLTHAGYSCFLGGNIGAPLLDRAESMGPSDIAVVELSSFQLQTMRKSPDIAVVTNLSPNHLDVHKSYREYIDAKRNILLYQNENGIAVINGGNADSIPLKDDAKGELRTFSAHTDGALLHLSGDYIYYGDEKYLGVDGIKIPGVHNIENYMAAIAAVHDFIKKEDAAAVATTFGGVEHRLELVRELGGVKYYNSSIDSSPKRTIAALSTFKQKVILLSGGKDKGIPYDEIGPAIKERVKHLILIGKTADAIEAAAKSAGCDIPIERCDNYRELVEKARAAAVSGDIVVLSPASTSFDMFKNFEERGNTFKRFVNELR